MTHEVVNFIWQYGGVALAVLVCGWSLAYGGASERFAAAVILSAWIFMLLVQSHTTAGPGIWVELSDVVVLILFTAMSLKVRRLWTIFMTALQLDAVVGHFTAKLAHYELYPYMVAIGLWGGYGLLIVLMIAVINHRRAARRQARAAGAH